MKKGNINPNRSNRGSAIGPPCHQYIDRDDDWTNATPPLKPLQYQLDRTSSTVARTIGFDNLITFQRTSDPSQHS